MSFPRPSSDSHGHRSPHSTSARPSNSPWSSGSGQQQAGSRRGLAPISTSFDQNSSRPGSSSNNARTPWSPVAQTASANPASNRQPPRSSSISAGSSPFSPPQSHQQLHTAAPSSSAAHSSRSRTVTSAGLTSSHSSTPAINSQSSTGEKPPSSSGRLTRASPSASQSNFNSPITATLSGTQGSSLSKIVITQVFLLLSNLKEDDQSKWESQVDQIRKLVDSNGMEVFTKYFRRLLISNAAQIWSGSRSADTTGSYQMLVHEVQKIVTDPAQANKIEESVEYGDGEVFKDFDLSTFMDHFKMNPFAKVALASSFKRAAKSDMRMKADAILSNNLEPFRNFVTTSENAQAALRDLTTVILASVVDRLAQYPPRNWTSESQDALCHAIRNRYHAHNIVVPVEVGASLFLFELIGPHNPLVTHLRRNGTRATSSLEQCKATLESAELQDINYLQVANCLLFMVISREEPPYNPGVFVSALREHRGGQRLDWQDVIHSFDREGIKLTKEQFKMLFGALMPLAREYENFDIQLLWGDDWQHAESQLTFLTAFLSCSPDEIDATHIPRLRMAYSPEDFDEAPDDVKELSRSAVRHPLASLDATKALFNMVFRSSETYAHAQALGVIENVINAKMDLFVCAVSAVPKPWGALQDQAVKQLLGSFLTKNFPTQKLVFFLLWRRDKQWLATRMHQFYQVNPMHINHVFEHSYDLGMLDFLIGQNNDLSLDLAALAHGRNLFNIEAWLDQITQAMPGPRVLSALAQFLKSRAEDEDQAHRDDSSPTTLPLAIKTVHALLNFLGDAGLPEDDQVQLQRSCIHAYPRLINYGEGYDHIIDENSQEGNAMSPDADARMQEHYKSMYGGGTQVREIVEILQNYKHSEAPAEQDLFACMIFGLFDEYNCFGEYPMDALATTAVLFGSIINFNLLSRIALKTALGMVLEAVRDYPPPEAMYRFGLQALLHFQDRLQEWKMFSERLLEVPGLVGTQIEGIVQNIVESHQPGADREPNEVDLPEETVDNFLDANMAKSNDFTCLHIDGPLREDFQEPNEETKETVLFILNNVSERNIEIKFVDLKSKLLEEHFQWFANYLVDQRIKAQLNFQPLYQDLLDRFDDKTLWSEVTRESYVCAFRMLNAESTMNSSSERSLLKNMGMWIGSVTLGRNQPVRFRNISFRDLLVQAHDSARLVVAIPFTCNVLSMASDSTLFRPPCAWTLEILQILVELYHFGELKLQLKFEIEILCKKLGVDEKKLEPSEVIRSSRTHDDASSILAPPISDGLQGFGDPLITRALSDRYGANVSVPELADIAPLLKHNYTLPPGSPSAHNRLRQILVQSVERAVQEICAPVVERSVAIATISSSQMVTKDFATEPDPARLQDAAHKTVKNLSGSLALVTCKEPLKTGISSNIRMMVNRDIPDHALPEGVILMFINDNLEAVCGLIEKAAETTSVTEIDKQIEHEVDARKAGEPFVPPELSRWSYNIPDPFKPSRGGLNQEQLAVYEEFGRSVRANMGHSTNVSQDGVRQLPDVLQDQYSPISNMAMPADAPNFGRQPPPSAMGQAVPTPDRPSQQMVNGYTETLPIGERIPSLVSDIVNAANEATDESPSQDVSDLGTVEEAWQRLRNLMYAPGGVGADAVASSAAESTCMQMLNEQLRPPVLDVLAKVLQLLCRTSEQTTRDIYSWARVGESRLNYPNATVALLKNELLDYRRIDVITAEALNRRERTALEYLSKLVDGLLATQPPMALRADFAHSMNALSQWLSDEPDLHTAQDISQKLQEPGSNVPDSPYSQHGDLKHAQVSYIFEEWVRLVNNDPPKASLSSFIQQLKICKYLATHETSVQFIRACVDTSVSPFTREHSGLAPIPAIDATYIKVDALAKMIVTVVAHQDLNADMADKVGFFGNTTSTIALILAQYSRDCAEQPGQKAFCRLFVGFCFELHSNASITSDEKLDMVLALGKAMLLLQPRLFPSFSFAWLAIVSHRMFMPVLLKARTEAATTLFCELLSCHLAYLGELLKPLEVLRATKDLYRGTMEVLLVLHHDFPDFLAENHFHLLNSIPAHCAQMRNLVLSASAVSYPDLPDPLTNGLKVDRLEEIRKSPVVRVDVKKELRDAGIDATVDQLLSNANQGPAKLEPIIDAMMSPPRLRTGINFIPIAANELLLNALVLYVVQHWENMNSNRTPTFAPDSLHARLFEQLAEKLGSEGRYYFVCALVNQLRYPNTHTAYFSYVIRHLFKFEQAGPKFDEIQSQIVRVILERLVTNRPHPWGLIITLLELLKNREYGFWERPFVKNAPDIERMFSVLFSQMGQGSRSMV